MTGVTDLPPGATVTYEFHDSSVPPPYHRSYVLTFDRAGARIVVDSYGDVLADRTAPMTEDAWATVAATACGQPPSGSAAAIHASTGEAPAWSKTWSGTSGSSKIVASP